MRLIFFQMLQLRKIPDINHHLFWLSSKCSTFCQIPLLLAAHDEKMMLASVLFKDKSPTECFEIGTLFSGQIELVLAT